MKVTKSTVGPRERYLVGLVALRMVVGEAIVLDTAGGGPLATS